MSIPLLYKSGDRYGRLMLTGKSYIDSRRAMRVECICDCENVTWPKFYNLHKEITKSCGCYHADNKVKHNMSYHRLYSVWLGIISRCENENHSQYDNYGGRGISITPLWSNSFIEFKNWAMDNGWKDGLEIDRIDNDGDYEPSNCRCSDRLTQSRNKRNNVNLTAFGEIKCREDWHRDERCSVTVTTITTRLSKGWSVEDAISKPDSRYKKS